MNAAIDVPEYLKFLSGEIELEAGVYTRAQLLHLATSPMATKVEVVMRFDKGVTDAVSVETTQESVPDEVVVDLPEIPDLVKDLKWTESDPPRGVPSILHFFQVLAWIKRNDKHARALNTALFGPDPKASKLAKNLSAVGEAVGCMPVNDTARWMFTVANGHVSPAALADAISGGGKALVEELWAWGLGYDCIYETGEVWRQAERHSFMPDIISGKRQDGVYKRAGSCAAVTKALMKVVEALGPEHRAKMNERIATYAVDAEKALAPLTKMMTANGDADQLGLIKSMLADGDIKATTLSAVFHDNWDPLQAELVACLDTVGPILGSVRRQTNES